MVEEISSHSDQSHVQRPTPFTTPDSYLGDGLKSGVFDASAGTCKALEFLNGFELTSASAKSEPTGELADNANACERRDFIAHQNNRLPVDVQSLWDKNNRVLAIGDQHLTTDIKKFTVDNMQAFKDAGATDIGIELFQKSDQGVLDNYTETKLDPNKSDEEKRVARAAVEDLLRKSQEGRTPDTDLTSEQREELRAKAKPAIDGTMAIIDRAIELGIKPRAIEPNISHAFASNGGYDLMQEGMAKLPTGAQKAFDAYTNPKTPEHERAAARAELERNLPGYPRSADFLDTLGQARDAKFDFSGLKLNDTSGEGDRRWVNRLHDFRNQNWAANVADNLKENPNSRMILFAGTQHFNYMQREALSIPSANEQLKKQGIGTTVLQFAGGDFGKPDTFDSELQHLAQTRAKQMGLRPDSTGTIANAPPPPDDAKSAALRYTGPAREAGAADKDFALRLKPSRVREADYIIHLKQN